MRRLFCGIAIAALAIGSAAADPGGQGKGGGGKAHADHAAGPGKDKVQGGGAERGPKAGRGGAIHVADPEPRDARGPDRVVPGKPGGDKGERGFAKGPGKDFDRADRRDKDRGDDVITRVVWRDFDRSIGSRGLVEGCPPGLAKKNNGCMPPGQLKNHSWSDHDADWWGLRGLREIGGYRYVDGNLVRIGPNGAIAGYYPLLGGALALGNPWPSAYPMIPLSPYHVDYFGLGNDYRYLDGAIYRLDPETQAIQSIAALLTGDDFAVGRPLPLGYEVYNVPYGFRDDYVDGPDAYYRYSDGYVYRVDPKTQLIVAAIDLLT